MAPALEALLYRSQIVNRIGPLHMVLLVERARLYNQIAGITGHLIYVDYSFMQYAEGPPAALDVLWRKLQCDPRHFAVELLARFPLTQRRYRGSSLKFSGQPYYRQYQMTGFAPVQPDDMATLLASCLAQQQGDAAALCVTER